MRKKINQAANSPKELFSAVKAPHKSNILPQATKERCNEIASFFHKKVSDIYNQFQGNIEPTPEEVIKIRESSSTPSLAHFPRLNEETILNLIKVTKSGSPLDPAPPHILFKVTDVILPFLIELLNHSLDAGLVSKHWKHAVIRPLLKKKN